MYSTVQYIICLLILTKRELSRQNTRKFLSNFKKIFSSGKELLNSDGQTERWVDTLTLTFASHSLLTFLRKNA